MRTFWTEIYERHFQHHFQKPFDVQVYHGPDGAGLKIATYDWAKRGFRVFASVGLADKLAEIEGEDFGEVVLFCDVDEPQIPQLFVNALFFILQHDIPLGSRFAIGFGDMAPEFTRRYDKTSLYFTHPADDAQIRQSASRRNIWPRLSGILSYAAGGGIPRRFRFTYLRAGILEVVQGAEQGSEAGGVGSMGEEMRSSTECAPAIVRGGKVNSVGPGFPAWPRLRRRYFAGFGQAGKPGSTIS